MKLAIAALLAGSAAAFAPAHVGKASTTLDAFNGELGAQAPLGFFDPLGLLKDADQTRFDRLRYVEVKHGRVAMLAFLGQITTRYGVHIGGNIDSAGHAFSSFPNGWAAISGENAIPLEGTLQMFAFIGFLETFVMKEIAEAAPGDFPGDLRNGAIDFGWDTLTDDKKLKKRAVELNNGRAAMMGILGLMVHEQLGSNMPVIGQL